jgi:hypothetical protein
MFIQQKEILAKESDGQALYCESGRHRNRRKQSLGTFSSPLSAAKGQMFGGIQGCSVIG